MKIIAFANHRYKRVALNWATYLNKLDIKNYCIYALDNDVYEFLLKNQINTIKTEADWFGRSVNKWEWHSRLKMIYELLKEGEDILHSDLDAIWLKDPSRFLKGDYDLVCSTGKYPKAYYNKMGVTICMGWIYFKSNKRVYDIFEKIFKTTQKRFVDQQVFNRFMFKTVNRDDLKAVQNNNKEFEISVNNIKLKILAQQIISRDEYHKNAYVVHPLSGKKTNREDSLKEKELWIIK